MAAQHKQWICTKEFGKYGLNISLVAVIVYFCSSRFYKKIVKGHFWDKKNFAPYCYLILLINFVINIIIVPKVYFFEQFEGKIVFLSLKIFDNRQIYFH